MNHITAIAAFLGVKPPIHGSSLVPVHHASSNAAVKAFDTSASLTCRASSSREAYAQLLVLEELVASQPSKRGGQKVLAQRTLKLISRRWHVGHF